MLRITIASLLVTLFIFGQAGGQSPTRKPATPKISITSAPDIGPGPDMGPDPIEGKAQVDRPGLAVVIYAFGDRWYVQPYTDSPFTSLDKDGGWSTPTHGGTVYAALLVDPHTFKAKAILDALPRVDGKTVFAVAKRKSAKQASLHG